MQVQHGSESYGHPLGVQNYNKSRDDKAQKYFTKAGQGESQAKALDEKTKDSIRLNKSNKKFTRVAENFCTILNKHEADHLVTDDKYRISVDEDRAETIAKKYAKEMKVYNMKVRVKIEEQLHQLKCIQKELDQLVIKTTQGNRAHGPMEAQTTHQMSQYHGRSAQQEAKHDGEHQSSSITGDHPETFSSDMINELGGRPAGAQNTETSQGDVSSLNQLAPNLQLTPTPASLISPGHGTWNSGGGAAMSYGQASHEDPSPRTKFPDELADLPDDGSQDWESADEVPVPLSQHQLPTSTPTAAPTPSQGMRAQLQPTPITKTNLESLKNQESELLRKLATAKVTLNYLYQKTGRTLPDWVVQRLPKSSTDEFEINDVDDEEDFHQSHFKTPARNVLLRLPNDAVPLGKDGTNNESVNDKQRAHEYDITVRKAKEKKRLWFSHYDPGNVLKTRVESRHETEGRNFAWNLLYVMVPSDAIYKQFVYLDVFSAYTYLWKYYFDGGQTSSDQDYQAMMALKIGPREDFRDFLVRAQELWLKINDGGFMELTETQFYKYLKDSMKRDERFKQSVQEANFKDQVYDEFVQTAYRIQRTIGEEHEENVQNSRFKAHNRGKAHSAQGSGAPNKWKEEAHEDKLERQSRDFENSRAAAFITRETERLVKAQAQKMNRRRKPPRANAAVINPSRRPNSSGHRSATPNRNPRTRDCISHKKWGACPRGKECKYEHHSENGSVNNTTMPRNYECYKCGQRGQHWDTLERCPKKDVRGPWQRKADSRANSARELNRTPSNTACIASFEDMGDYDKHLHSESDNDESNEDASPIMVRAYKAATSDGEHYNNFLFYTGCLDSAASFTMFGQLCCFVKIWRLEKPKYISVAAKSTKPMVVWYQGDARIRIHNVILEFKDAYWVPGITESLFAVSNITSCWISVVIYQGLLRMMNMTTKPPKELLRVPEDNGVYPVEYSVESAQCTGAHRPAPRRHRSNEQGCWH